MITLNNRLKTAAELCRNGKIAVDVGCDHAQLACWLALNKSARVIASDLREGPLEAPTEPSRIAASRMLKL